jgi:hypothetical protein
MACLNLPKLLSGYVDGGTGQDLEGLGTMILLASSSAGGELRRQKLRMLLEKEKSQSSSNSSVLSRS